MKDGKNRYYPDQNWERYYLDNFSHLGDKIAEKYKDINGFIVLKNGYIISENYYNGFDKDSLHNVASVTKSVLSSLIGIALDRDYLKNIDQKVLQFFPEYSYNFSENLLKTGVTIEHLLKMNTPFPFSWKGGKVGREPLDRLRREKDWVKYALDMMGDGGKIGEFHYSTTGVHLLSAILTKVTKVSAREFFNREILSKIGGDNIPDYDMKNFDFDHVFGDKVKGWVKDRGGNSAGGFGLTIKLKDMARFGYLYLNNGVWRGEKILSKSWIEKSWHPYSDVKIGKNLVKYGYLWWIGDIDGIKIYSAIGDGGNIITVIPNLDIVISIVSKVGKNSFDPLNVVKYILSFF